MEAVFRPRSPSSEACPEQSRSRSAARPRQPLRLAWFFACLLPLVAGLVFLDPIFALRADFRTAKGEIRAVLLPDGSRATLNADSAVALRFEDSVRRIELLRGEAFFEVAKDTARPFVVASGEGETKAVGTTFTVRQSKEKTEVAMLEGVVEASTVRQRLSLKAGQVASLQPDGQIVLRNGGIGPARRQPHPGSQPVLPEIGPGGLRHQPGPHRKTGTVGNRA
ncbi:FecR family protein [Methylocaldum sp.]|uniref:FecR family protein n=1 Tax=Methylocaldum sp. TaxID=1969727 RepID=UPI002D4B0D73|nr:FecR domain-containing protein [Methylocaldum sp.]HYE37039.1 FecR domain-containing protein [Methylocaldum sp.]